MNREHDLEHEIHAILAENAPVRPPEHLLPSVISSARRRRRWPRWYALVKEPTMHTDSRLAVGSPTVRVAAILAATIMLTVLVAGAGVAATRLIDPPRTFVVAQDGSGDVATITEAVAMAVDGDTILVRPGTYREAVTIDEDIRLSGDGLVADVILEAPDDGPVVQLDRSVLGDPSTGATAQYALLLRDADATVSDLTFRGEASRLFVRGGAPVLQGLAFEAVGERFSGPFPDTGSLILVGSRATIRDSDFRGGSGIRITDRAQALVLANELTDGASIAGDLGDEAVLRGNEIIDGVRDGIALLGPTTARIEGNTIEGTPIGITVGQRINGDVGAGVDPYIGANTISGSSNAIHLSVGAAPTIEGNTLVDNAIAISAWDAGAATIRKNDILDNGMAIAFGRSPGRIEGNTVRGGGTGVSVTNGATVIVTGNVIEGMDSHGVVVMGSDTRPSITGNRICAGGSNVFVEGGLELVLEGNELCPEAAEVALSD